MNEQLYRQESPVQTLTPNQKYCHACASVLDVRAQACPRCCVPQPVAAPLPSGLVEKSPGLAVVLALCFGPLGLLYASGTGTLVMLLGNLFLAIALGPLALIITTPICMIWAVNAVHQYNDRLRPQVAAVPSSTT